MAINHDKKQAKAVQPLVNPFDDTGNENPNARRMGAEFQDVADAGHYASDKTSPRAVTIEGKMDAAEIKRQQLNANLDKSSQTKE